MLSHFENREVPALDSGEWIETRRDDDRRRKISNLSRAIVDAAQARVARNRPSASFITTRGNYSTQRMARRLGAFVSGVLDQSEFYATRGLPLVVRDAIALGTGGFKIIDSGSESNGKKVGEVRVERVLPWRVFVDPAEANHGKPRSKYEYHPISRMKLVGMYPEKEEAIMAAPAATATHARADHVDEVLVHEAWHLPSYPGADDGRHVVCVENADIAERPWKVERFPFAWLSWTEPTCGYWGQSLIEDIEDADAHFNELLWMVEQALWHHSNLKILESRESEIEEMAYDNDIRGTRIKYSAGGGPPQFVTHQGISGEVHRQIEWTRDMAWNLSGVSEASATSQKPAGLNSGVALREWNDQGSERFIIRGYGIEAMLPAIARRVVDAARMLEEDGYKVATRYVAKKRRAQFVEKIKWSEVSLDDDAFVIRVAPGNSLQDLPGYKVAAIEDLWAKGAMSKEQYMALLDMPDVEGHLYLENAPLELILDQLERMIDEGEQEMPEPFQDPAECVRIATRSYLRARLDGVPEERLSLVRNYIAFGEQMVRDASGVSAETPPPDAMPAAPPPPKPEEQGMNGAQVTALVQLAEATNAGRITADQARTIASIAFAIPPEAADKIAGAPPPAPPPEESPGEMPAEMPEGMPPMGEGPIIPAAEEAAMV